MSPGIEIEVRSELHRSTTHVIYARKFPSKDWLPLFYGNEHDAVLGVTLLRGALTVLRIAHLNEVVEQNKTVRRVAPS